MKCVPQNAVRHKLFICLFLVIQFSFAQKNATKSNLTTEANSNLTITDDVISIDLKNSSDFINLNNSNNVKLVNKNKHLTLFGNGNTSKNESAIISKNLSESITPNLSTTVNVKLMQRKWRVNGIGGKPSKINISYQENLKRINAIAGSYYMLVSKTGVFDSKSDFKIMSSDGNGKLSTDYNFDGTHIIAFGFSPQVEIEGSIYFDGTDDYINMKNKLNLNPSGFTISAWVKRDRNNSNTVSMVSKRDTQFNNGYDFRVLNTNQIEIIWKNNTEESVISNASIPYNEWHHIATTYRGSEVSIYIDGVLDKSERRRAPIDTNEHFHIGAAGKNTTIQHFSGNIDEVRIWNVALSENQLRFLMNQEIAENKGYVMGKIIPSTISKNDVKKIEWSKLAGYYPMSAFTYTKTNDASGNGVHGSLRNITTVDRQSAPLPYQSIKEGDWDNQDTWLNGNVQYIPGSASVVDPNITVDWNIIKTSHYVTMDNSGLPTKNNANRKVLGLYIDANELVLSGDTNSNEGNGLIVSHYLNLTGKIDLEGESQLIQELKSDLDIAPTGEIERDQQGPSDTFTYKYWSSPVGKSEKAKNDYSYSVKDVLYDGEQTVNFITAGYNGAPTYPIGIADYWIWKYANQLNNSYSSWQHVRRSGTINAGEGFTMKGPGTGSVLNEQNYVFRGKPNNGDIKLTIHKGNDYLVGNPYASAIDANKFIIDNSISNSEAIPTISGTLYFWKHWGGDSHNSSTYQGGYATYNFSGGVGAASYGADDPFISTDGSPTKIPSRFIPVGQGFFVVGNSTGTINFNNGQRLFKKEKNISSSYFSNSSNTEAELSYNSEEIDNRMKFRIGLKSINTIHRQLLLTIDENSSPDVDWAYDAKINEIQMDDMYWIINDEDYIIQASDKIEDSTVFPIGVKTNTYGLNTITIDALENVPSAINIYLYDNVLELYHNLRESNYDVLLNAGQYNNRFQITFSNNDNSLSIKEESQNGIDILYANGIEKMLLINPNLIDVKSIELFNMLGQSIYTNKAIIKSDYSEYNIKNLRSGTYIIKLSTKSDLVVTKKVLVQ